MGIFDIIYSLFGRKRELNHKFKSIEDRGNERVRRQNLLDEVKKDLSRSVIEGSRYGFPILFVGVGGIYASISRLLQSYEAYALQQDIAVLSCAASQ